MLISNAALIRVASLLFAALWIMVLSFMLPDNAGAGKDAPIFSWHDFLINTNDFMGRFNLQVMIWITFFYSLGELVIRWLNINEQLIQKDCFDLHSNPDNLVLNIDGERINVALHRDLAIKPEIMSAIFMAKKRIVPEQSLVFTFMRHITYQFQSTNNVGDVYSSVNALTESELHKTELNYTVVKYLVWLIPTLGFIGTVIGIVVALGTANTLGADNDNMLAEVIPRLAQAFYTTLLALLLSAIVMVLLNIIEARDERVVNEVSGYFQENVVTNLKPRSE